MDWKSLGESLAKIGLPILGAALPLPGGAALGVALANDIGATSSDPGDVMARLTQSADALDKARAFESAHQETLLRMTIEAARVDEADVASARGLAAQEIARGNAWTSAAAAWVRPVAGFGAIALVGHSHLAGIPMDVTTAGLVGTVFQFYFGGRVVEKIMPHVAQMVSNLKG